MTLSSPGNRAALAAPAPARAPAAHPALKAPPPTATPRIRGAALAGALAFTTIVFQHFQIATIGGYFLTLGLFSGLLLIAVVVKHPPYGRQTVVWALIIGLAALAAVLSPATQSGDFTQTLLLFLLTSFIVVTATGGIRSEIVRSPQFARGLFAALVVVSGICVGQVALGTLGSDLLFNPFGPFQYFHAYAPGLQFGGIPRAQGFYLEPSYASFVIGSVAVALLSLGRKPKSTATLALFGLLACQSATGLLVFAAIVVVVALRSKPKLALFVLVLGVTGAAIVGDYLVLRLSSITEVGTSANYRLLAPLEVLRDVLLHSPFGQPLGSVSDVISSYGFRMAGVPASSLDNGLYVIIFYFGWAGLVAVLIWFLLTLGQVLRLNSAGLAWRRIAPLWLFASLLFSGAIMAPEYGLMAWLVIVAFRQSLTPSPHTPATSKGSHEHDPASEHRDRHLPGSPRPR
ncbi:putative colanic acid polymerase WcaD [Cryobacterium melibiosiphilum]|uniref:Putative colanic acid polymerase WcaD n=1 Tax=Cryobacterium melibiosiphilum TaxID=995039 RepID=A0A3A5MQ03_9MICO|nr:putative colanic acid polymerase WcaD [Cryobacterium melibiosiphilum]RJT91025.1 putative colanic acid polymerase WcaD [Cryobacterium melibiosiphilum]